METATTTNKDRLDLISRLGLKVESTYKPHGKTPDKYGGQDYLCWDVRLLHRGRLVVETEYSAGQGHCPSYRQGKLSIDERKRIELECKYGKHVREFSPSHFRTDKPIIPDTLDAVSCLLSDASALNCPSFESWADELGMDTDSRRVEQTYRQCLDIGLRLRAALGEQGLKELREYFQDY